MLCRHADSLCWMLVSCVPEYNWLVWMFDTAPRGLFKKKKVMLEYIDWLGEKLCIKEPQEWYQVSIKHVNYFKGSALAQKSNKFEGLMNLLKTRYPKIQWKESSFFGSRKTQLLLFRIVRELLPKDTQIQFDYIHPQGDSKFVELDIYVPSLCLAFEYQGYQHYEFTSLFGDPKIQMQTDHKKRLACELLGITLIQIPYWWEYNKDR